MTTPTTKLAFDAQAEKAAATVEATTTADLKTAEKTISGWHINGWLAILIAVAANVVGALLHV